MVQDLEFCASHMQNKKAVSVPKSYYAYCSLSFTCYFCEVCGWGGHRGITKQLAS